LHKTVRFPSDGSVHIERPAGNIIIIIIIIIIKTIIKKRKEKTGILIDVAIPADRNVTQKEAENKLNYNKLHFIFTVHLCITELLVPTNALRQFFHCFLLL
jgi:hypothetical protein